MFPLYPLPVISKAKVCDSTNEWPTILRKRLTNSLLDFDNGRPYSGMDVSEVPSFGRNRMVADIAPENESPAGAFLFFLLIFYLFFIGDRASF